MDVIRFAILGLAVGGVYSINGLALTITYRASETLNFAQAAFGMAAAFLYYDLTGDSGWHWIPALVTCVAVGWAIGATSHLLVMRPLRNASSLVRLIATLGLLALCQGLVSWRYGDIPRLVEGILPTDVVEPLDGVRLGMDRFWLLGIAMGLTLLLGLFFHSTIFGKATSAVAENPQAAAALGHSPDLIATVNWGLGSAVSALAAILIAPISGLDIIHLTFLVIPGVAAALIGGFRSFGLTLAGGLAIGIAEAEIARFSTVGGLSTSVPFIAIVAALMINGRALPERSFVPRRLPRLGHGRLPLLVLAVVWVGTALLLYQLPTDWVDPITTTLLHSFVLLSLIVVTGMCGQLSIAQVALVGVGAWISGRTIVNYGLGFEVAALLAIVGCALVGVLVSLPALRTRGVNLAIATLGLALVIEELILDNFRFNGGIGGTSIGDFDLFGFDLSSISHPNRFALFIVTVLMLVGLAVANLRSGRTGRALIAVRSNERAAASLGVSVPAMKTYAFALAGGIAGVGGVLTAYRRPNVDFTGYTVLESVNAVLHAVIGGVGYIAGSLWGGTLKQGGFGSRLFSGDVERYFTLASGAILIVILLVNQNGMAETHRIDISKLGRRLGIIREGPARDGTELSVAGDGASKVSRVEPGKVEVLDATVRFKGVTAVDRVSLTVAPGTITGLIGSNGSGKTTLVDAITGFVPLDAGEIRFNGEEIHRWRPARRAKAGVSRSFQSLELFEDMTVLDNLRVAAETTPPHAFAADLVRIRNEPLPPGAAAAVEEFQIGADLEQYPGDLPFGRRRLVAIARAVAAEPSVMLLDEPAAGLDAVEVEELQQLLVRLRDEWGIAVLLIEHDVEMVLGVCDNIVVLDAGRVIAEGPPEKVANDERVLAAYLGNELDATHGGHGDSSPVVVNR